MCYFFSISHCSNIICWRNCLFSLLNWLCALSRQVDNICMSSHRLLLYFIGLCFFSKFVWKTDRKRDERVSICLSFVEILNSRNEAPSWARNPQLMLDFLNGYQEPKYLSCHLLPPILHISRRLELKLEPEPRPGSVIQNAGIPNGPLTTAPGARPYTSKRSPATHLSWCLQLCSQPWNLIVQIFKLGGSSVL